MFPILSLFSFNALLCCFVLFFFVHKIRHIHLYLYISNTLNFFPILLFNVHTASPYKVIYIPYHLLIQMMWNIQNIKWPLHWCSLCFEAETSHSYSSSFWLVWLSWLIFHLKVRKKKSLQFNRLEVCTKIIFSSIINRLWVLYSQNKQVVVNFNIYRLFLLVIFLPMPLICFCLLYFFPRSKLFLHVIFLPTPLNCFLISNNKAFSEWLDTDAPISAIIIYRPHYILNNIFLCNLNVTEYSPPQNTLPTRIFRNIFLYRLWVIRKMGRRRLTEKIMDNLRQLDISS